MPTDDWPISRTFSIVLLLLQPAKMHNLNFALACSGKCYRRNWRLFKRKPWLQRFVILWKVFRSRWKIRKTHHRKVSYFKLCLWRMRKDQNTWLNTTTLSSSSPTLLIASQHFSCSILWSNSEYSILLRSNCFAICTKLAPSREWSVC